MRLKQESTMRHLLNTALGVCALAVIIGTDAAGNPVLAWGHHYGYGSYHARSYYPRSYSYRYYYGPSYYYDYGYYPRQPRYHRSHHHRWHRHWQW
jgi:hypothetical protein